MAAGRGGVAQRPFLRSGQQATTTLGVMQHSVRKNLRCCKKDTFSRATKVGWMPTPRGPDCDRAGDGPESAVHDAGAPWSAVRPLYARGRFIVAGSGRSRFRGAPALLRWARQSAGGGHGHNRTIGCRDRGPAMAREARPHARGTVRGGGGGITPGPLRAGVRLGVPWPVRSGRRPSGHRDHRGARQAGRRGAGTAAHRGGGW